MALARTKVYKKIFRRLKGFKNWNDEGIVHNQRKNGIYLPIHGSNKDANKCVRHQRAIDSYGKSLVILRNPVRPAFQAQGRTPHIRMRSCRC